MKAHIVIRERPYLIGILGVGVFLLEVGLFGRDAGPVAAGQPAVRGVPGSVPARPGETNAVQGSVWEGYASVVAAATTFPCCVDGTCTEMSPGDCASAAGTVVCACLGDVDDNGADDACEGCAVASTPLAEDVGFGTCSGDGDCPGRSVCRNGVCYVPKNRYISFDPNNSGRCVALRIDMTASDTFPGCTLTGGAAKWVGEPDPVTGIARIEDAPVYRNWTEIAIDVGDMEIVPASTYEVRAIEQACDPGDPYKYSAALDLLTVPKPTSCEFPCSEPCYWADIVGELEPPGVYLPPDGILDYNDIVAMIKAITGHSTAPPITWADLMREVPNGRADIRDLLAIDDACRVGQPYPGASPCGTASVDEPSGGLEWPSTIECRLFDTNRNRLVKDELEKGVRLAIPSQTVTAELFLSNIEGLRAYQAMIETKRGSEDVSGMIDDCPDGVYIDYLFHQVCAGTRENCVSDDECKWCVGGSNVGNPCTDDQDCPDEGTCEAGPGSCVGGGNNWDSCTGTSECPDGQCMACPYDFPFFATPSRNVVSVCSRREVGATGDPVDLGETPPGYLGSYKLNIPADAGGITFDIHIVRLDSENQERTFLLTRDQTANDPSSPFSTDIPARKLRVLFDCNLNGMPDQCDIGDETTCASDLCQAYTGSGRPECGQSNNCNNNEYPDECEIAVDPDHPGEFFCSDTCIGCTADCVCSKTGEPCPEECNYVTGEGCPEDCLPRGVPVTAVCDPDCNLNYIPDACDIAVADGGFCTTPSCSNDCQPEGKRGHGIPDECDITQDDGGLCEGEGGEGPEDCSWDCQPNQIPDECEANCNPKENDVGDWCPDDCEDQDRSDQGCGQGVAEGDCDGDEICNVDEISVGDGGNCVGEDCSADCHFHGPSGSVRDLYLGIPDECDLGDCQGSVHCNDCDENMVPDWCDINVGCEATCCRDCQPPDPDKLGHGIPDGCDIRDCDGDITCRDWNYNGVPDACDLPRVLSDEYYCAAGSCTDGAPCLEDSECEGHLWPFICTGIGDPADCASCDANGNGLPDEYECPGASQSGACENAFDDGPAEDTFTIQAAFAIQLLDENDEDFVGLVSPFTGVSGSATIWRGTPHFHGDPEDTPGDQPCLVPPGFPEPQTNDFARSREVHLKMTDLTLSGPDVSLSLRGSTLGEAQGTCIDFPADVFFTLYVQVTIGTVELHNETPVVLRAELSDFEGDHWWDYTRSTTGQRRSVMVNDHSAPAIPLMDASGEQRAYLTRIQLGQGTFTPDSGSCEAGRAIDGPVSFVVDGGTTGVAISSPNEVYEDREKAAKKVRAYVSSGATPSAPPDTTNVRDATLIGNTIPPDGFSGDDRIKSLSFGQDGTRDPTAEGLSPILYFSVDGFSLGVDCTDVQSERNRQGTAAADVFTSPMPTFGAYAESPGALPSACDATRGNCLVADNTALGLGPHASTGMFDNVVGLELDDFDIGDLAYLTFLAPSFGGDSATIWVYGNQGPPETYPFEPGNLQSYASAADLGLKAETDTIDALVVSDVTGAQQEPDGVWNTGDEVLFSLAPGSQTLIDNGWSGAHIFKVSEGQTGSITAANVFLEPAALGLEASTDNVDAIDVGAGRVFDDCNHNAIDDSCDIARGFSADDIGPLDGVPDECQTPCTVESTAPEPERLALPGDPISQKNRYISFIPSEEEGKAGRRQAIRVTFEDLAAPFAGFNGEVMWVGEPIAYCENAGKVTGTPEVPCPDAQPSNEFLGATLKCKPYFRDWHGVCSCGWCRGGFEEGKVCSDDSDCAGTTIHLYHELIIPGSIYRIDVIDQRCLDLSNELSYSDPMNMDPLATTTSVWGDAVRNCTTNPCGAPDGTVGIPTDVTAVLDKFKNLVPPSVPYVAITKARADLDWATPNQRVDISDVTCCLDAFRGVDYPPDAFYPPPEEPPEPPWCDGGASGR